MVSPSTSRPVPRSVLRSAVTALLVGAAVVAAPLQAQAQALRSGTEAEWRTPRITGVDVEQVSQLTPGTSLVFTVYGSPGLRGRISIDGAARTAPLEEEGSGRYRAWYTIGTADRVSPNSRVTANLQDGARVATATLGENLVSGYQPLGAAAQGAAAASGAPMIERFDVQQRGSERDGAQLVFFVKGTPGAQASVRMRNGPQRRLTLNETRVPGEYTGTLALPRNTLIDARQPVTAVLRLGDRTVSTALSPALEARQWPAWTVAAASCADCGTVLSIRPVDVRGEGSYVGPIAGGVLGAVLGNQVGGGSGRKAATAVGAIGGAVLGREIERRRGSSTHYDVAVRMQDGTERTISVPERGDLRVGDPVKVSAENAITLDTSKRRAG